MKKILMLGGTGFVERILTEELIKAGNPPVLFNRGKLQRTDLNLQL